MEENLLKYFFNDYLTTYEEIKPINVENGIISNLPSMAFDVDSMVTNDGNYYIRYGGRPLAGSYNAIEVYNNNSIKSGQPLLTFSNLTIYGHTFTIRDMKQDEDGRFYALANFYDANMNEEAYLVLFNNFIQDGFCQIRKFYTAANMGITSQNFVFLDVVKKEGSADYYIRSQAENKIYHFKIDVVQGNSLETYNFTDSGTVTSGSYDHYLQIINDTLILTEIWTDENDNVSCKKLAIDITAEIKNSYSKTEVLYEAIGSNQLVSTRIDKSKYYISYLEPAQNGFLLVFEVIDLNGNVKAYSPPGVYQWTDNESASFTDNYFTFKQDNTLEIFYYDLNEIVKFYSGTFNGVFSQIQVLKQFDLVNLVGLNSRTSLAYSMNVYSVGYSSEPYMNTNFLIPQYLNLYSANNNTSLIYSRDVVNRFLAGNQLTTTFNVPNYLLNNTSIKRETVYGQTNLAITDNVKTYTKNRFENLYLTYIYGIQIIDNTNGNNLLNTPGSNRLANSVWNLRDSERVSCLKARITYEDGSQSILNSYLYSSTSNSYTLLIQVNGEVRKVEYLSYDEQTVYATFRCELTGQNDIFQTIQIS